MFRPGKDKGIATPIPLGLAALGTSIFLMGFALIFQPTPAWSSYFIEALLFGGVAEFLAGIWAFAYGDPLAATTFSFLGVFYGWWGLAMMLPAAHAVTTAAVSTGMVFVVAAVVTLYLWVASFFESTVFNLTLLFLWFGFALVGVSLFTDVTALAILGGIAALISGLIAGYGSFAEIYNATSLQEMLPVGEPASIRERSEHDEQARIRRIHPMEPTRPHADMSPERR